MKENNPEILEEIRQCVATLRTGGIVIIPSEAGWLMAADCNADIPVSFIASAQNAKDHAVLIDDAGSIQKFLARVPDSYWDLAGYSSRPLNIITGPVVNLKKPIISENHDCAFRVAKDNISMSLISRFGKALYTAIIPGEARPEFNSGVLNTPVYVVNLRNSSNTSSIVVMRLNEGGRFEFIRH